jgi:hypothetical protein
MNAAEYLRALRRSRPPTVANAILLARVDSTNALARRTVSEFLRDESDPPAHVIVAF